MGRRRRRYRRRNPKTLGPYIESGENLENLQTDGSVVGWFLAKSLRARLGGKRKRNRTRGWRLCPAVFHREEEKKEAEDEEDSEEDEQ